MQVAVLVELKARFDEATNVTWAKALERAGVHVVYGLVGLKTHAKCVLVVRARRATGCAATATSAPATTTRRRPACTRTSGSSPATRRRRRRRPAVQPPHRLQPGTRVPHRCWSPHATCAASCSTSSSTRRRFGAEGRITAKLNSLADPAMIEALYAASQAGVQIDLVVRGICCLRAGVPGPQREHPGALHPRSLPRALADRTASATATRATPLYLIGSADWMPRNLDRRVEVLVPVAHPKHQEWLDQVLEFDLADDIVRWEMDADGSWQRRGPEVFADGDAQERFYHWVADRQRR